MRSVAEIDPQAGRPPAPVLISALADTGARDLEVVSNNCGVDDCGLGLLLCQRRIRRVIASYVGENKEFARQYLAGELEVELTPQGTLAERLRAGGSGIPAFYTATGVGTQVAEGGLPWRYAPDGSSRWPRRPRQLLPSPSTGRATTSWNMPSSPTSPWSAPGRGDRHGNLVFHRAARNFNPLAAMAGRITIAEVEELVEPGELDPDADPPARRVRPAGRRPHPGAGVWQAHRKAHSRGERSFTSADSGQRASGDGPDP